MKNLSIWLTAIAASLCLAAGETIPGRYIVELEGDPALSGVAARSSDRATADERLSAISARRGAVRAEHDRVRPRLEASGAEVTGAIENVANALLVHAPGMTREQIAQLPGVKRVHPVKMYYPALNQAIGLEKVPDAWVQLGGWQFAGVGRKIAIIDTGIDSTHPAFQDAGLKFPAGYPQVTKAADRAFTNSKIIVARNYDPSAASTAKDTEGHGTAVAMIAAGVPNAGPYGLIVGVAPKAWLGNYKVFPDGESGAPDDQILKALDDAAGDGMDVVNLSLGSVIAELPQFDVLVEAVERLSASGIIVTVAAGNDGPDLNTISSPGTAKSAITVGNSWNDRVFSGTVTLDGLGTLPAMPGGTATLSPVSAPLLDVATLDQNGLACESLPANSLAGRIAFILRGTCTFEVKLNNAQAAGAKAALVYTYAASPDAITMSVGAATLPSAMLSYDDGQKVKAQLAQTPAANAAISFERNPVWVYWSKLNSSSSGGPPVDNGIKPDMLAVGTNLYTATLSANGQPGYLVGSGTSFSSPMVAGAAAVLKAARPGLRAAQYRSLLINSSSQFEVSGGTVNVQQGGAGLLNLLASLNSTLVAEPTSVSFGVASGTAGIDQTPIITVSNIGAKADTITMEVRPAGGSGAAPVVIPASFDLNPGATRWLGVRFRAPSLDPGAYQGFVVARSAATGNEIRIPYWYGVPSNIAATITILNPDDGASRAGSQQVILFRPTDASGIPVATTPVVTVAGTAGNRVLSLDSLEGDVTGAWLATVRLGARPGDNLFNIKVGDFVEEVAIKGN